MSKYNESIAFYENKLGFKSLKYDNSVILNRDGIEIHLWLCKDKYLAENSSCYIRLKGIEELYQEFIKNNVIHPNGKLEIKPWGMKEFVVLDNSGNGLNFGEYI